LRIDGVFIKYENRDGKCGGFAVTSGRAAQNIVSVQYRRDKIFLNRAKSVGPRRNDFLHNITNGFAAEIILPVDSGGHRYVVSWARGWYSGIQEENA
jgi:hypothetical protein